MLLIAHRRTRVSLHITQHNGRLLKYVSAPDKGGAVGANLVAPSVPTEVGKTRAFVQVPHRSMKPGQRTEGLQQTGKPESTLRGSAWSTHTVRPHCSSPSERSDI